MEHGLNLSSNSRSDHLSRDANSSSQSNHPPSRENGSISLPGLTTVHRMNQDDSSMASRNLRGLWMVDLDDPFPSQVNGQLTQMVRKPGSAFVGRELNESAAAQDLRARPFKAANVLMGDVLRKAYELPTQKDMHMSSTDDQESKKHSRCSDYDNGDHNHGLQYLDQASSDRDRVLAVHRAIQLVVREAVQMVCHFSPDEEDMKKGKWYTLESGRALRILETARLCEELHSISYLQWDAQKMRECYDGASIWLHGIAPRLNQNQMKQMYEWEASHPSLEDNLAALGFDPGESERLGVLFSNDRHDYSSISSSNSTLLGDHESTNLGTLMAQRKVSEHAQAEKAEVTDLVSGDSPSGAETESDGGENPRAISQLSNEAADEREVKVEGFSDGRQQSEVSANQPSKNQDASDKTKVATRSNDSEIETKPLRKDEMKANHFEIMSFGSPNSSKSTTPGRPRPSKPLFTATPKSATSFTTRRRTRCIHCGYPNSYRYTAKCRYLAGPSALHASIQITGSTKSKA